MWAIVDPAQSLVKRQLWVVGTGFQDPEEVLEAKYVGTVRLHEEGLVFHIFDGGEVEIT